MLAKLAFLLLPKDLFQGRPTERLLRASGWTYLSGVVVSLVLYALTHPQYDYRIHLISAVVFAELCVGANGRYQLHMD